MTGNVRRRVFFFSSRRRHTRLQGDWSSDVCSSDLPGSSRRPSSSFWMAFANFQALSAVDDVVSLPAVSAWLAPRLEERRVGEEGRFRWAPDHLKKKHSVPVGPAVM